MAAESGIKGPSIAAPKSAEKDQAAIDQSVMATIQDDDERLLARIGYKQVSQDSSFTTDPNSHMAGTSP